MITGIDETGDFDPKSTLNNFFISVHIDQNVNKYKIKQSQFKVWESSIQNKHKAQSGEIKGKDLPDDLLSNFYNEVIEAKPTVLFSVVCIIPSENPVSTVEKRKSWDSKEMERVIREAKNRNSTSWVEGYTKILYWYNNRNYQTVLKMKCLEYLLGISLNRVLGWAQITYMLDKFDSTNIDNIQFKIDKDFIRADNVKQIWEELLRQFWLNYNKHYPLGIVPDFKQSSEYMMKKFGYENGKLDVTEVFRQNISFVNSEKNWEVRMADIIGTILHRYENKGRCIDIGTKLTKHLGGNQQNYLKLVL